jgi:tryptophan-rich sensory protein
MSSDYDWLVAVPFLIPLLSRVLSAGYGFGDRWYGAVPRPWFSPPRWVFGPVWFFLYLGLGFALRATAASCPNTVGLALMIFLLGLNVAWTPLFLRGYFGASTLLLGVMVLEAFVTAAMLREMRVTDVGLVTACMVAYCLWLVYAFCINYYIYDATRANWQDFIR